jgi:CRP-like cAMP-binding protein
VKLCNNLQHVLLRRLDTTVEFRNYLLAAMPDADLAVLQPHLSEVSIDRGQVVYEPNDLVGHLYFPSSAVLSVVTLMLNGEGVESSTVGHESAAPLLSALANRPAKSRIFAQIGGGAIKLPVAVLRARSTESPKLQNLLLRHARSITFQAEQGVACNVLHEAPMRLARWLLMTNDRTGTRQMPLTQEYMAIMTGVQRTTISAVASQLKNAGLIRYARGNVEILDRAGLEARACECYVAIRQEFDSLKHG